MSKISYKVWGAVDAKEVYLFRIENSGGAYAEFTNYGATIVSVNVPDKDGKIGNVILGFPALEGYLADTCYIGATIGRFANRIDQAKFVLDNKTYYLHNNDNGNANHSGKSGFNFKVFGFSIDDDVLAFHLLSPDGDGGFPGELHLKVSYEFTYDNRLLISYHAVTNKKSIANFTNHAYFNLNAGKGDIVNHKLIIAADTVLKANAAHIPTGLIAPAAHLSFNGQQVKEKFTKMNGEVAGLNIYYILNKHNKVEPACILTDDESGRVMEVCTSYPGVMLYTGDYLHSTHTGNGGKVYKPFDGLCLECQYYPDSPNHSHFPSTELNPGETYQHNIQLKFTA